MGQRLVEIVLRSRPADTDAELERWEFEELEEALVKAGRSGTMSWHEVEVGIQGITEAFKPGIEAIGDVKGALDALLGSGGRGVAALKGV